MTRSANCVCVAGTTWAVLVRNQPRVPRALQQGLELAVRDRKHGVRSRRTVTNNTEETARWFQSRTAEHGAHMR